MTRVDELQKRYPNIPRDVIVKMEVLRHGINDTADLDKVSVWERAGGSYVAYDLDSTAKEMQEKKREKDKAGFVKSPEILYTRSGLGALVMRTTKSPYEVKEVGEGKFALFEGDARVDDVFFMGRGDRPERVTSKGTPITSLVSNTRRCFFIFPVRHCEYFNTGDQCKFCNFQSNQEGVRSVGVYRPVNINLDETVEAFKILSEEVRLVEGHIEMGALVNKESESKIYLGFVERITKAAAYKPNLTIQPQPMGRKEMQRFKDLGVNSVTMQMEIWDPNLFAEVCPGKAKSRGREGYIQAFQDAVDVFGVGHVACNFVAGVGLIAANGHKTWQECRDSTNEGMRWMIERGVYPSMTALRLQPGSIYGADPANIDKRAPTEYYLEVCVDQSENMKKRGLYDKVDKFAWCPNDCLPFLSAGDIGILEKAGDIGTWLSDVVPAEANWMSKLTASAKSPAKTS